MTRRRPAAIGAFTALFLLAAGLALIDGIRHLDATAAYLAARAPGITWSRDAVIVALSARLSIALIPTALVWFGASNFARWMVTVIAAAKLGSAPAALRSAAGGDPVSPLWAASVALGLLAVACLFTPQARRYFSQVHGDAALFR